MSTAIEELLGHLIAGEVIDGTQTDPDEVVFLRVLTKRNREAQSLDLLRDVHQTLSIPLDKPEPFQFFPCQRIVGGIVLAKIDQLLIHHVAHQSQTVFTVVVIDVAVDFVFVDVLGEEQ